jgi:hypothetical protein
MAGTEAGQGKGRSRAKGKGVAKGQARGRVCRKGGGGDGGVVGTLVEGSLGAAAKAAEAWCGWRGEVRF